MKVYAAYNAIAQCSASRKSCGFTLIELIAVIVILGIVSGVGSNFIVSTVRSYDAVQTRSKLMNRGRLVIEQMTRQIRSALPNSTRVSASGNCVEFMPLLAGVNYLNDVPDNANNAAQTTSVDTAPFTLAGGDPEHVSIAALDTDEIYETGSPSSRVGIGVFSGGPSYTEIPFASSHRFERNSVSMRVFISADPIRFCLLGDSLFEYSEYGFLTTSLGDASPGGTPTLMAEGVSTNGQAFSLSQGTEDVSTALSISLRFTQGSTFVDLQQQVLIRNVP